MPRMGNPAAAQAEKEGGPPPRLYLGLLGGFTVSLGALEVPQQVFARRKARSLLKLLALQHGHRLHRDRVMDLLWPNLGPRAAAAQLYKAIHHVRRALAAAAPGLGAEELIGLRDEMLRLGAPGGTETDAAAFERAAADALRTQDPAALAHAAAAYRGDLLPEDLYEGWTGEARRLLAERFAEVLIAVGETSLKAGRLADAADAFRQALARDAINETAHRGLMRAFALHGSRERALRQYRLCVEALERELEACPSPETEALHRAIQEGALGEARPVPALAPERALSPLVGRQAELAVIGEMLDALARGQGGGVAMEGEAGMGKTRLCEELLERARGRGFQALAGGAHELEGRIPYGPIIEALSSALAAEASDGELVPSELAAYLPGHKTGSPPAPGGDPLAAQGMLFAGVLRFVGARARVSPVALVLDDLHAADEGSLEMFHYLARQTRKLPLLVIGAWRSAPPRTASHLGTVAASLERQGLLRRLRLAPLSDEEHRTLLGRTLGAMVEDRLAGELYRRSEGNPLYALEMVRQLASAGAIVRERGAWRARPGAEPGLPPSLQLVVEKRSHALSPGARQLLNAAAVAGREVPHGLLEGAAGPGGRAELLDRLDELVASGLLEEAGLQYRFPHALYREAVYQQMSAARRRELHGEVARALEAAHTDDAQLAVEAVAYHYLQAGDVQRAVRYLVRAADRAESLYAHDDARRRYEEALEVLAGRIAPELVRLRAEVHERIGDVHRAEGDVAKSLAAYGAALTALEEARVPPVGGRHASLHRKVALAAILSIDLELAAEHLARGRALIGADRLEEARWLIAQALSDWHRNSLGDAVSGAERALAIAEAEGAAVEASQACELLAMAHLPLGNWEEGLRYEMRRQVAGWSPDIVVATDGHLCLWEYHVRGEEPYRKATEFIGAVAQHAAAMGHVRCVAVCHYALGSMELLRGLLEPAGRHLAQALELNERVGSAAGEVYTLAQQALYATAQGEVEAGWEMVKRGVERSRHAAVRDHCLRRIYGAGLWNRRAARDLAGAAEVARGAVALERAGGSCYVCSLHLYPALAAYHLDAGQLDEAWKYAERALQLTEQGRNRAGQAATWRVQGEILAARDEPAAAMETLRRAAEAFRELEQKADLDETLRLMQALFSRGV